MAETQPPHPRITPEQHTMVWRRRNTMLAVLGTILGLLSFVIIILVMLWIGRPAPPPPQDGRADARATLAQRQAADRQRLNTYEWIDRENGIVRIPVELAMERLIEEHQP